MRILLVLTLAMMTSASGLVGCAAPAPRPHASVPWRMNVAPNQVIEFEENTLFSVDKKSLFGWQDRYSILVGPLPDARESARVAFANSIPSVYVYEGFGYFLGKHPRARTRRVIAAGQATEMIVQAGNERDRVFLIDEAVVVVVGLPVEPEMVTNSEGPKKLLDEPMTFLEATLVEGSDFYTLSDPMPIESDPEAKAFVEYVLEASSTAGLP